ncbi:MAG: type II secretion system protein GspD, partial [Lentisphaeria bacterium]
EDGNAVAVTNSTPSIPEFDEPTELGVILTVTPTVAPGSSEIELNLVPKVSSFVRYDEEIQIPFPGIGTYSPKMAITEERTLRTRVICDDGETVVLGGLMREKVTSYSDRVPLLADIPLFGKLFRAEGEYSEKANLLVFVTARLVDSSGRVIRDKGLRGKTRDRGLPTINY